MKTPLHLSDKEFPVRALSLILEFLITALVLTLKFPVRAVSLMLESLVSMYGCNAHPNLVINSHDCACR